MSMFEWMMLNVWTGKMAAKYLARVYGSNDSTSGRVRWALAGRRREALEEVRRECMTVCPSLRAEDVDILVADSVSLQSLADMAALTSVVISTTGAHTYTHTHPSIPFIHTPIFTSLSTLPPSTQSDQIVSSCSLCFSTDTLCYFLQLY